MTIKFPYEQYKAAIDSESETRAAGVAATVVAVEGDESREGCFVLGLSFMGRFDEGLYENGRILVDGFSIGQIVEFADLESGMVVVKGRRENMPNVGSVVKMAPADYLEVLREFAAHVAEKPELRNESRFLSLREDLLAKAEEKLPEALRVKELRFAQELAIRESVRRDFSLLWGPPGTGKSYTLGHMAAHYRALGLRVLVLSTTNSAVDVTAFAIDDACTRLDKPLESGELVRYAQTLTNPGEYGRRPHLMGYTLLLKEVAAKQRKLEQQLAKARVKIATLEHGSNEYLKMLLDISRFSADLLELGCKRKEEVSRMLSSAKIVCSTVTSCLYNGFSAKDFDVVLVDEASLIPLAVWPALMNRSNGKKFIVAGDPMQLQPVGCKSKDVDTRFWFEHNIYDYLGMNDFREILPFFDAGSMTLLNEQTRMRKGICSLVSKLFYRELLKGDRANAPLSLEAAGIPDDDVIVIDTDRAATRHGFERLPDFGRGKQNARSAEAVLGSIRKIVDSNPKGQKIDVLVITPFRDQKKVYDSRIKVLKAGKDVDIRVSTVHSCQGSEADIVFFDVVNPLSHFVTGRDSWRMWCVACSRAKEKLVLVGSVREMLNSGGCSSAMLHVLEQRKRCLRKSAA